MSSLDRWNVFTSDELRTLLVSLSLLHTSKAARLEGEVAVALAVRTEECPDPRTVE